MGKPIIWSGVNAKLINSGDLVDKNDLSLTNGDKITVTQASHGFTSSDVGRPLYLNGSTWTLAQADTAIKSEVAGFIYAVLDANTLRVSTSGQCPSVGANFLDGGGSLTAGELYFLSPTTAGKVTLTEPTTIGQISKPIAIATSTSAVQFFNFRGYVVGAVNARTQITLNNNTTANVQDMGSYDAGEITGWVYIDATTDYRFFVSIRFAKAGSGSTYNLSYTTVGDTPPAGFSFTITSAGVIQYTMPNVSGYVTALMNYALNAPAVGATFPLSVSGTSVVGGTPTVDTINEYTTNNGVQIQGRKSGAEITAGYVGEEKKSTFGITNAAATAAWKEMANIQLTAGIWLISGTAMLYKNSATLTDDQSVCISTTSASNSGTTVGFDLVTATNPIANNGNASATTATFRVRISTTTTYYLNCQSYYSAGTPQWRGGIAAVRIA